MLGAALSIRPGLRPTALPHSHRQMSAHGPLAHRRHPTLRVRAEKEEGKSVEQVKSALDKAKQVASEMVSKAQQGIGKAVENRAGGEDLAGGAVGEHGTQRAVPEGAAHMGKEGLEVPGQGLKGEGGMPAREASEKMGGAEGQDMPEAGSGVVPEGAAHMSKEGLEVPGQELKGEGGVPAKEVSEKMGKAGEGEEWDH